MSSIEKLGSSRKGSPDLASESSVYSSLGLPELSEFVEGRTL